MERITKSKQKACLLWANDETFAYTPTPLAIVFCREKGWIESNPAPGRDTSAELHGWKRWQLYRLTDVGHIALASLKKVENREPVTVTSH